ncbi:hypothetical protein GCM10009001_20990 [Virgibacillus siamensis]|uniref:DUF692 family protein n=1 Tax=Virgibacillus siamensis TaxID=480071 RepID=A0ABP3R961_9BACI
MKFAVNYSPEVYDLLEEGTVKFDLFKCPDFDLDLIKTAKSLRPSYVHFDLNVGSGNLDQTDWSKIEGLLKKTDTPYVNVHLVAFAKDFPHIDINTQDSGEIDDVIQRVTEDIQTVAAYFGRDRVIAENVIYRSFDGNMLRPIIDPDIISEIIRNTGCGFLLDTAHAQMTCKYLGKDVYDYIPRLPLDHLKELHITGIQKDDNNRLRDSMPLTEEDWELADWVLQNVQNGNWLEPWVASLEYGGVGPKFEWRTVSDVLKRQVPELNTFISGIS